MVHGTEHQVHRSKEIRGQLEENVNFMEEKVQSCLKSKESSLVESLLTLYRTDDHRRERKVSEQRGVGGGRDDGAARRHPPRNSTSSLVKFTSARGFLVAAGPAMMYDRHDDSHGITSNVMLSTQNRADRELASAVCQPKEAESKDVSGAGTRCPERSSRTVIDTPGSLSYDRIFPITFIRAGNSRHLRLVKHIVMSGPQTMQIWASCFQERTRYSRSMESLDKEFQAGYVATRAFLLTTLLGVRWEILGK